MAADKSKKDVNSSFTVESETTGMSDMPSVTRLLNRKSLGLSAPSAQPLKPNLTITSPQPPTFPPIQAASPSASKPPVSPASIEITVPFGAPDGSIQSNMPGVFSNPSIQNNAPVLRQEAEIALSINDSASPFQLESSNSAAAAPESAPENNASRIQKAKPRTERRAPTRVLLWETKRLKSESDPLGQGVARMLDCGAKYALFLSITSPSTGSPVPLFTSSAAIAPQPKLQLWTGLVWDPKISPEMWNLFVRAGFVELPPPSAATNVQSNRNVVRTAFGAETGEYLLLVRAGPAHSCRGVLALISDNSLLSELTATLPLLSAPAPVNTKKSA